MNDDMTTTLFLDRPAGRFPFSRNEGPSTSIRKDGPRSRCGPPSASAAQLYGALYGFIDP